MTILNILRANDRRPPGRDLRGLNQIATACSSSAVIVDPRVAFWLGRFWRLPFSVFTGKFSPSGQLDSASARRHDYVPRLSADCALEAAAVQRQVPRDKAMDGRFPGRAALIRKFEHMLRLSRRPDTAGKF